MNSKNLPKLFKYGEPEEPISRPNRIYTRTKFFSFSTVQEYGTYGSVARDVEVITFFGDWS